MANPNIVNVTTIFGKTFTNTITTGNVIQVANPASSGNVFKINSILITNNFNNDSTISLELNNADGTGTAVRLANVITVPSNSTLVAIDKSTSFYLEEDTSIKANTTISNSVQLAISYEIIS
jgi:hypothetical protein